MNYNLYNRIVEAVENKKITKADLVSLINEVREESRGTWEETPEGESKIISIDSSSTITGWALYENGHLKDSGIINLKKEKDSVIRCETMVMEIFELLKKYSPNTIVVENNVVGRNAKTERMLGHIVGTIEGWSLANFAEFVLLSPSEWRKAVKPAAGPSCPKKREEAKQWSINRVSELFGKAVNDDEADAILLGYALCLKRS